MANKQYGTIRGSVTPIGQIGGKVDKAAVSYENDYEKLTNHPSINSHELIGDQTGEDLGLVDGENEIAITEIDRLFNVVFGE